MSLEIKKKTILKIVRVSPYLCLIIHQKLIKRENTLSQIYSSILHSSVVRLFSF